MVKNNFNFSRGLQFPGAWTIARFTLIETLRGRLALSLVVMGLLSFGIAVFIGEMAITESAQIQGSALAAFNRIAAAALVMSFVVTGLAREHADKGLELLLSQSIPRASYVVGKLGGYSMMSTIVALAFGLPLIVFAPASNVASWTISLGFELSILTSASIACGLVVTQGALSLLMVGMFYLLSRVIASILAIISNPLGPSDSMGFKIIAHVVEAIAALLPNLDGFATSAWLWLGAGGWTALPAIALQSCIYVFLLAAVALFDFYRKNL